MRVSLNGKGDPIARVVLPDPGDISNLPATSFLLEDGTVFEKAEWVAQGYINYEVWCIGAAGGRGGGFTGQQDGRINPGFIADGGGGGQWRGGGGGGGGVQRKAGLLSLLPDEVPVTVGQAGGDGQNENNEPPLLSDGSANPAWIEPLPGQDGGYSLFGVIGPSIVAAGGGGAGGLPTTVELPEGFDPTSSYLAYLGYLVSRRLAGRGGDGGRGFGLSGGGALGAYSQIVTVGPHTAYTREYINAEDGTWDGEIGEGGGGGVGGAFVNSNDIGGDPLIDPEDPLMVRAGQGGKGSYSFGDPSIFGIGQAASFPPGAYAFTPGIGGGGRYKKLATNGYGSRAPGYNPNGVVFIRLMKYN